MVKKEVRTIIDSCLQVVIVGANVNEKPNFMTVGLFGWVDYEPKGIVSISIGKKQYTNIGIKENKTFSVNIPSEDMLELTDYVGIKSGRDIDKSKLFDVFYGELKTAPMIKQTPVSYECKLIHQLDFDGLHDIYFGKVVKSYANEDIYEKGANIKKLNPVVLWITDYYSIGKSIGKAFKIGHRYTKD
jgi:flavin reductase (DIM6/NTAB) family NADH-FMN oxidoreductase RutF